MQDLKYSPDKFCDLKPGMLIKLHSSLEWHNAYLLNQYGKLGDEIHFQRGDVAMYVESQLNKFQPDIIRYKCLFGDQFMLINSQAVVPVQY